MHILDLPPELADHVLYFSMLARDNKRALRLKLVCKTFYAVCNRILFTSGFLDGYFPGSLLSDWPTKRYHTADRLWHDYLVFNCQKQTRPHQRRFAEMRSVADALLQHYGAHQQEQRHDLDFDTIIDRLCWLGLSGANHCPSMVWNSERKRVQLPPNPGLNLLSAATYFGCEALVRDLISQGHDPLDDNELFPSAMYVAAWTGQADLLQLMQEVLPPLEGPGPVKPYALFRSKIGPGSLEGAATRGDIDMVRLALYPPSRSIQAPDANNTGNGLEAIAGGTVPGSELVIGEKPGSIKPHSKLGLYIQTGMRLARSPEVYDYLRSFILDDPPSDTINRHILHKASVGDVVMVRHLLEAGADPSPQDTNFNGTPLMRAIMGWQEEVVDLLLEHGADPNERGGYDRGTILTCAARAGSIGLMRKMLDSGVKIDHKKDPWTVYYAIRKEHTAIVEMMLEAGVDSERALRIHMKHAREKGLESMVELLERWLPSRMPPIEP